MSAVFFTESAQQIAQLQMQAIPADQQSNPSADGLKLSLTADASNPLSSVATQVHFQHAGGVPETLTFWVYTQDGLGRTSLNISDATAQAISKQVAGIVEQEAYKNFTFKSINFSKALITFLDADGKEHTFALNHDDCPFLNEINHIIEGDKDFVKQIHYHGFHHYSRNQKGNTRAENSLGPDTLTPRLKEHASVDLAEASKKLKVPKEARKRAQNLLDAKVLALEGLIKNTEDQLDDARKNHHSQVLGLEAKLKKLKDLSVSCIEDPDYDAIAFCLEQGFIQESEPLDAQVAKAQQFKQRLIDQVKKLPSGNPHASEWVQHDKHLGQTHTHFKGVRDFFGFTAKELLDAEDRRMTAIAGMLVGSHGNRLAYCEYMKAEGREIESDPAELAILRYALDGIDVDQIRDGQLLVLKTDDPVLQREVQEAIADELEKLPESEEDDSVVSRGSEADGDKLKIEDDELDPTKDKDDGEIELPHDDGSEAGDPPPSSLSFRQRAQNATLGRLPFGIGSLFYTDPATNGTAATEEDEDDGDDSYIPDDLLSSMRS